MRNLIELIVKNFMLLFRNKTSTLIFILGPLAVVLMLGFAFNTTDIYGLKLGVYSYSDSNLTSSLLQKLSTQFTIVKAGTVQNCIDGVKLNDWHVCLIFPEDFRVTGNNTIEFYVNPTKINLVDTINNIISAKVAEERGEISTVLVEAILLRLSAINTEIQEHSVVLDEIKTMNADIKDITSKLQQQFSSLDLDFNESDFQIVMINDAYSNITEENKKIGKANENVSDSTPRGQINAAYLNTIGKLSLLEGALGNLSLAVNSTKPKLDSVKNVQGSVSSDFGVASQNLDLQLDKIKQLEDSVSTIKQQSELTINSKQIVQPINTNIKPITQDKRYINFIFPILIVLLLMFGGVFLGSSLVISEKTSRAYFRNLIVPVRRITFILASYITTMIILLIEVGIVFSVIYFFTKIPVTLTALGSVFIIASIFVFIGLFIGYFSRTAEISMLISIALVAMLLFFSNLILPIETIAYLRDFAIYNPFTIAAGMIKENMLLQVGFKNQVKYVILLFAYLAIAFVATLLAQQLNKKRV